MIAFHGDVSIKAHYLDRVRMHARADEIIHGKYWEDGKGCAVGCTIHDNQHSAYETELGIPIMLARLEDRLFEGQSNGRSKEFPERFLMAAKVGADLSRVGWKFLHWLLTEELASRDDPRVANQIKRCADVLVPLTKGEPCDKQAARADAAYAAAAAAAYADAASAADAAAYAAASAYSAADAADAAAYAAASAYSAASAADAAAYAVADAAAYAAADAADAADAAAYAAASAYSAADAADAAAYAAASAYSAADAADAATYAAASAYSADAAAYAVAAADAAAYAAADAADAAAAARSKCYERMAEKLLELMAECEGEPIKIAMGVAA